MRIPLLVYSPDVTPGVYTGLTSVVDVMPTVLDVLGQPTPAEVDGASLLPKMRDTSIPGREFVVSTIPFANPGDPVRSVDNVRRQLRASPVTTVTSAGWSLLHSMDEGMSELYNLSSDPKQRHNVITDHPENAREVHQHLVRFLRETNVVPHLVEPRLELRL